MTPDLDKPIFIGGTGRSGTTVLSVILDQHPDVLSTANEIKLTVETMGLMGLADSLTHRWGPFEGHHALKQFIFYAQQLREPGYHHPALRLLAKVLGPRHERLILKYFPGVRYSCHVPIARIGLAHYDACVARLVQKLLIYTDTEGQLTSYGALNPFYITRPFERAELLALFREFLDELYAAPLAQFNKRRWLDDTPRNFLGADFLLSMYPQMKLIHMLRDPRDVIASYGKQVWASHQGDVNIQVVAGQIRSWCALRETLPAESYCELRLEDLVAAPEATLRHLCDFLELDFHPAMLKQDLSASHAGRYNDELTADQIRRVEVELRDWMTEKHYL